VAVNSKACTYAPTKVAKQLKFPKNIAKLVNSNKKFLFLNNYPIDSLNCIFLVSAPKLGGVGGFPLKNTTVGNIKTLKMIASSNIILKI